jgi:L-arabinonolactonase
VLLGLAKGLAFADIDAHQGDDVLPVAVVAPVEAGEPQTRVNDGRTDREGHFVFGTMNEAHQQGGARIGHFYQFSSRRGLRRLTTDPVAISNSLCFSPDGGTIYFADTLDRAIMQGDYDAGAARVSRVRPFARLGTGEGLPDGSVVDADGCLWNAAWASGHVRQFAPDGRLVRDIALPIVNATCPAFGGRALDDLFVTSSRQEMDDESLARMPQAGGVFRLAPGVRGIADLPFADLG